jgi:hypothetical protein
MLGGPGSATNRRVVAVGYAWHDGFYRREDAFGRPFLENRHRASFKVFHPESIEHNDDGSLRARCQSDTTGSG